MPETLSDTVVVRTDATINSGDAATIEVGEDVGATGTVDTSVYIDLQDGQYEYEIGEFEGGSGNEYYVWGDTFQAGSEEQTPQLHALHVDIISLERAAELYGQVSGDVVTVPLYVPEDLDDPRFRARTPGGAVLALALVDTSESPLHCRTPDGEVHGVHISNRETSQVTGYGVDYGDSYGE